MVAIRRASLAMTSGQPRVEQPRGSPFGDCARIVRQLDRGVRLADVEQHDCLASTRVRLKLARTRLPRGHSRHVIVVPRITDVALIQRLPTGERGRVNKYLGEARSDRLTQDVAECAFHLSDLRTQLAEQRGRAQSTINHASDVKLLPQQ
ncbi:hypothetical protein [Lentzea waywayandensis]|uniref:hypothetical protein n=1 Tax=Lentzea waywayandensis TaxID=84724 RepID=UPI001160C12E|nr:hypothetical protein [Lentzea waywayandensis]